MHSAGEQHEQWRTASRPGEHGERGTRLVSGHTWRAAVDRAIRVCFVGYQVVAWVMLWLGGSLLGHWILSWVFGLVWGISDEYL